MSKRKIVANVREKRQISEGLHVIHAPTPEEKGIVVKKRVAAYCRVSTDMEVQLSSIETQMESYKQMILEHPNWELAGIYADQETATEAHNRKEFQRMIADARAGKIDMILAKSTSRFARNTVDTLTYVRELKEIGVGVYFEKEKINTGSPAFNSELILTVYAAFSQEESRSLSENMKRGIRQRFHMGIPKWAELYGYERVGKDEWGIVESEAKVVRKIFKLYTEGTSSDEIAAYLNRNKVPSPAKRKDDTIWHGKTVRDILKNEKYAGDCLMQKYYTVDHLSHREVRNHSASVPQYYKEGHHEGIVKKRDFNLVQRIMAMNNNKLGIVQYPYYGMLICPHCGKPMVKTTLGTKLDSRAWICGGDGEKVHRDDRTDCPVYWFKERYITEALGTAIESLDANKFEGWKKTDIEWVQNYWSKKKKIDLICLEKLVKQITFSDWETMQVTWKFAGETRVQLTYDRPSDYPTADIRVENGKTMIGNKELIQKAVKSATAAVHNNEEWVRKTEISFAGSEERFGLPEVRIGGK